MTEPLTRGQLQAYRKARGFGSKFKDVVHTAFAALDRAEKAERDTANERTNALAWQRVANQMLGALIEASGMEESSRRVFAQAVQGTGAVSVAGENEAASVSSESPGCRGPGSDEGSAESTTLPILESGHAVHAEQAATPASPTTDARDE